MNDSKLDHTLSPYFPKMRIITEIISNVIGFIVLGVFLWLDYYFAWPIWAFWILIGLVALSIGGAIWSFVEPIYSYRSWRYQFDEVYLQFTYGVFKQNWVTIPMTKIQSVSTSQGPIMKHYNIRSIKVETMGTSHVIPGLEEDVALKLREQLSKYATLKEVDE